jgi:hypothetical protein
VNQRIKDALIAVALMAVTFTVLGLGVFKGIDWYDDVRAEKAQREVIAQYLDNLINMQDERINQYCEFEWQKEQPKEEK